ncbi:MAG: hypothetical protein US30_C0009G0020 [Candidatus Moranbacteria bacterium GW2011_GWF2_36_839]|nr:MAG: hypothetical protein US27_C0009G0020 [Candidatus Moranbacteria bacterium GW2011_GWF1_36_78]KKQ16927.1 MAG: hypothetical protein US30_C0009G0020 [Candidatus Moranbacteria bacterium GW2011_GWF2_36_839]HAT73639.1 hypothetical protein [Candidatus Moranbacteria bacterium]HBY10484.1 hypothetical protein [Candidatus Moranbacteria bacterium]
MDLLGLKIKSIRDRLGINDEFGKIYSFIDFGNINYWFEKDTKDCDDNMLLLEEKMVIDLEKLANFSKYFSEKNFYYYGVNPESPGSVGFISKARDFFDKANSKPIQKIKHYLGDGEIKNNTRSVNCDKNGDFVYIPKCNFDVEIAVDAIRLADFYDTCCIFSGDADFVRLVKYLKEKKKKIIIIKGGFIQYDLAREADLIINAQDIKPEIAVKKQKSSFVARLADRDPVSTGRAI